MRPSLCGNYLSSLTPSPRGQKISRPTTTGSDFITHIALPPSTDPPSSDTRWAGDGLSLAESLLFILFSIALFLALVRCPARPRSEKTHFDATLTPLAQRDGMRVSPAANNARRCDALARPESDQKSMGISVKPSALSQLLPSTCWVSRMGIHALYKALSTNVLVSVLTTPLFLFVS